jgi:YfiR/HmsC-like
MGEAFAFFRHLRRSRSALLVFALCAPWAVESARAQTSTASFYGAEAVLANFLFNFIRFTEWPPNFFPENAPFVVGVAGDRALEDELFNLADRQTARDKRVRVVRVNSVRDLSACHVLYIKSAPRPGEETAPRADELLPHVKNQPVLTISDSPLFLSQGGIINLYVGEEGKQRFEISPKNAEASGLTLSSRLLALARIVNPPVSTSM